MTRQFWKTLLTLTLCYLCIAAGHTAPKALSVNAKFSGTLIENLKSCTIYPGDENITLPFPQLNLKDLQNTTETKRFPFSIRLENCEVAPGIPRSVKVYLSGNTNSSGMLMPDQGSSTQGIVIGIENTNNLLLPINSSSPSMILPLNTNEIAIDLQAYVKVENNSVISAGDYHATLNYILEYE